MLGFVWRRGIQLGLGLLLGSGPAAAEPHWPLDLPPVLTSSFAEFRTGRLHAGMDLGTGGRVGIACRATGDGSVVRMRMSPFGYGKALYIQMDGGPLVVYAHLSAFAAPMASRARSEQTKRRRYTFDIDLPPGEMRVRAGEVVAWSGQTGVGVPHLHFELRHGDVAINPQTNGFQAPDTLAPVISEIAATPMDPWSHVDGGLETRAVWTAARGDAPLRVVGGTIGFSVRTWDHATSREYRQTPYRLELRVDGQTLYRIVQDRFDYDMNHLLMLEYDSERLLDKDERVQLLYLRPGDRLPGREAPRGHDGLLVAATPAAPTEVGTFAPGPHDIEVEVADTAGHVTVRRTRVVVGAVPRVVALDVVPEGDAARWRGRVFDPDLGLDADDLMADFALSRDGGAHWDSLPGTASPAAAGVVEWRGGCAWDGRRPLLLRARVRDRSGLEATATTSSAGADSTFDGAKLTVRPLWRSRWVELDIQSSRSLDWNLPRVVWSGGSSPLVRTAVRRYRAAVPPAALESQLELRRGDEATSARAPLVVRGQYVAAGGALRSEALDPDVVVDVPAGAVLEDIAFATERVAPAKLDLGPELRVAGPCVAVRPQTVALDKPLRIVMRTAAPTGIAPEHVGLFWVNRSGNLRFLAADRDPRGWLVAETRNLSTFAALADTTPPHIGGLQVSPGRSTQPQRLRFTVYDRGADLGSDGIDALLDGAFAIAEWDPESNVVIVDPAARLGRGPHELRVTATDQLGNRRARVLKFTVP